MRVQACLYKGSFVAVCFSADTTVCSYFQRSAACCSSFGRTFNPKVVGSIPTRPIAKDQLRATIHPQLANLVAVPAAAVDLLAAVV
jgi:hypothetical protein